MSRPPTLLDSILCENGAHRGHIEEHVAVPLVGILHISFALSSFAVLPPLRYEHS